MNATAPIEAHETLNRRFKRHFALISVLVALYPPIVTLVYAPLTALAHQQDVEVCRTLYTPSGFAKRACEMHNTSPLLGVVSVLTFLIFPAILTTIVSGHLALYHQQPSDKGNWRHNLAIIGLVLGYTWAAFALWIWVMAMSAD